MKSEDRSSADDKPNQQQNQEVSAECAAFEKILARVACELGNVREEQFDNMLTECLKKLVEFLGFDRSTVMLFSEHGKLLGVTHCWAREGIACPSPGTLVDADLWYTRQIRLGHILRMSNIADLPPDATKDRAFAEKIGVKSAISIPLIVQDTVIGAVAFGMLVKERRWPAEMVWRLRLVGEILASALLRYRNAMALKMLVQTADLMSPAYMGVDLKPNESRRRLAIDLIRIERQERLRMSDVLHEDVMQMLAGIGLFMELLREANAEDSSVLIAKTNNLIQEALRKLRKLAIELRPETLTKSGLVEGLRSLTERMLQTYGLSVELHADDGIGPVNEEVQVFLYSAACKLLDNIAAHAQCNGASLEVQRIDAAHIRLTVSDHGTGFNMGGLEDIPSKSFGLFSIREQAELLGGHLEVISSPGNGTRAILTLPG